MDANNTQCVTPNYCIGIGASAGGLEALRSFVNTIPTDSNHAYIIIQHLSPDFKSMMPELLARHTDLPIVKLEDGTIIEANHIYLAPPRKNVMLAEGNTLLVEQMENPGGSFPIDAFFRSLAEDQQNQAIAIILSGTGSDGSRGIQAIKEVGGLVVVQEPSDATFDGMPFNAVKTGYADIVDTADKMLSKILQYTSHTVVSGEKPVVEPDKSIEHALSDIYSLLKAKSDIDFSHYKGKTIVRRIERRMGINMVESVTDYYSYLLKNPKELQTLAKDMLIGVTRFFRDDEAFDCIVNNVIPDIINQSSSEDILRIWSACCSTGEEAYSLAILVDEYLKQHNIERVVRVFATDVDADAITEAGLGRFSRNIEDDVTPQRLNKYFDLQDDYYVIKPHIRKMVIFATHNLLTDPPFSNCQLAVCRNALIYFQPKAQKRIITLLHFSLNKDGYLFLGSSESLGEMKQHFNVENERHRVYRKIDNSKMMIESVPPLDQQSGKTNKSPSISQLLSSFQQSAKSPNYSPVLERIIEEYSPPAIILSEEQSVVHVFGDVSPYTKKMGAGQFSSLLSDYIIESLSVAVSTALYRAQSLNSSVHYEKIQYADEHGNKCSVNLRVLYLDSPRLTSNYFVVLFEQEQVVNKVQDVIVDNNNSHDHNKQLISDLEDALRTKQEHLQVTVEELQTTNEELQSSNEELMAANEELQSTNEELQSVNEELYTVNSEYQEKMELTLQSKLDTDNVIRSADIGFIFLDEALLIRKFSPSIVNDVNLLESDVGRPFHHISHALDYDDLLTDVAEVMRTNIDINVHVNRLDNHGQRLVKISPYRDQYGVALGCVINITDITEIVTLKSQLHDSWQRLKQTQGASLFLENKDVINLLIVDDDEVDLHAIRRNIDIERADNYTFNISTANNTADAITMITEREFDVCIIDYLLAGDDGLVLIEKVQQLNSNSAFILLSGMLTKELREKAFALGVYDVLAKDEITPALIQRSISYTLIHKKTNQFLQSCS
ncbi:chemotaxis protein CheB [Thalassotalea sp. 1_MG-2023]|uniref:chemotaxis protein CheB n=1 Tax=Thalassotalea sp. 1_MG-2023 TaxID=3062680 RepID=UPI0026E2EB20|nr:chemotaxis protein CheB [Thalassotalea sp. 1_MG-2023]MDO6425900.1 chemotaxis protein CheB [Thalassotalea sp. 1_MG-2023]